MEKKEAKKKKRKKEKGCPTSVKSVKEEKR